MEDRLSREWDVIVVGGSYAGLSAAMALGRALRRVLIIDNGQPCNRHTPHSHNFLTQDGETPAVIASKARAQVLQYPTVQLASGWVNSGRRLDDQWEILTSDGNSYRAKKLIVATGIKDKMPAIPGFEECWGKSVIHCPYCHGYEVRHQATGIVANGDAAYHYARLISNWTSKLTIFTNGTSTLSEEQRTSVAAHGIQITEARIARLNHREGMLESISLEDNSKVALKAIYARPEFVQQGELLHTLGCELNEQGYVKVDAFQKTTVPHVLACGDNSSMMRSVANAVATGNMAGAVANHELIEASF
ncbi:MAG: NAD(P)/FAD-dependent oxidoreductase [Flavipsychrobacter sp.]|nr:NAD(P)/FAD-dependent oxidoreductase [Flavipsychrobacter sp.]